MLDIAKDKNVYDELKKQEIIEYLKVNNNTFDLIIAGDVLPYLSRMSFISKEPRLELAQSSGLKYQRFFLLA